MRATGAKNNIKNRCSWGYIINENILPEQLSVFHATMQLGCLATIRFAIYTQKNL
jgi:hypothetical protein